MFGCDDVYVYVHVWDWPESRLGMRRRGVLGRGMMKAKKDGAERVTRIACGVGIS